MSKHPPRVTNALPQTLLAAVYTLGCVVIGWGLARLRGQNASPPR